MAGPLRLDWSDEALEQLEELTAFMPSASEKAETAIRQMAESGFHWGRKLRSRDAWYFPVEKIGVYYEATATTLRVVSVVDARRLKTLPH